MIQSSGGLSKDQIEKMVKEAEANAEADKKRKDSIEAINAAESVIHDTEKNLDDFKDDLEADADKVVREKVAALREYLATDADQLDGEQIRKLSGEVQQESLKAFEVAYKKVRVGVWGEDGVGGRGSGGERKRVGIVLSAAPVAHASLLRPHQRASANDSGNSSAQEGEFEDVKDDKDDKEKK